MTVGARNIKAGLNPIFNIPWVSILNDMTSFA
jgi:hypothetical protein